MQLPQVKPAAAVRFSTPDTNAGSVYLSASPVNVEMVSHRFAIAADTRFPFKVSDLSLLWASGTAADVLDILCETKGGDNENG